MSDYQHLSDFLEPVALTELFGDHVFHESQFGHLSEEDGPADSEDAPVVLVGVTEQRGDGFPMETASPDMIRRQLYPMYHWHHDIGITDLGNIRSGSSLTDTYAALKTVLAELLQMKKTVIILGGSHDLTTAQYQAYGSLEQIIEATMVDALIDLHEEEGLPSRHFLMDMLTAQPNFIGHYNHIGFQSYFIHPRMLETLDKLRFDFYRLGMARENLENMEPVIRQSHMLSFDMCALRSGDSPASRLSPNGFAGDEACTLMRYAGMGGRLSSVGIYGYRSESDRDDLSAIQAAQMIWYFLDGYAIRGREAALDEKDAFLEFHVSFSDMKTSFLKSKRTGRWWMQLPGEQYIPCAYHDYLTASNNGIPERWLRAQERL
ncbi:MAG TPA: formimidoylglutamase [Chitinophagaceae bacterium]|jgi:arginase family enzyme|nr:formimidoylglutamase [Chitinophagaceae bacterium]